jgi:hypothetical protein
MNVMDKVYKTSPEVIFTVKDGILKLIFLDEVKNQVVSLEGPAAEALQLFNGKRTLSEIKIQIDEKYKLHGDDGGFQKMIEFFLKNEIIVEA